MCVHVHGRACKTPRSYTYTLRATRGREREMRARVCQRQAKWNCIKVSPRSAPRVWESEASARLQSSFAREERDIKLVALTQNKAQKTAFGAKDFLGFSALLRLRLCRFMPVTWYSSRANLPRGEPRFIRYSAPSSWNVVVFSSLSLTNRDIVTGSFLLLRLCQFFLVGKFQSLKCKNV